MRDRAPILSVGYRAVNFEDWVKSFQILIEWIVE